MDVSELIAHIEAVQSYAASHGGSDETRILTSQGVALLSHIANAGPISLPDATRITKALSTSSFPEAATQAAMKAVDDRVLQQTRMSSGNRSCGVADRGQQSCPGFPYYLVDDDWADIAAHTNGFGMNVETVSFRAKRWGISCPKESLCGLMASIIWSARQMGVPNAVKLKSLKDAIHTAIKDKDATEPRYPFVHRRMFPWSPQDMSNAEIQYAVGDAMFPELDPSFLADIQQIQSGPKFLRKTASQIKQTEPDRALEPPKTHPLHHSDANAMVPCATTAGMQLFGGMGNPMMAQFLQWQNMQQAAFQNDTNTPMQRLPSPGASVKREHLTQWRPRVASAASQPQANVGTKPRTMTPLHEESSAEEDSDHSDSAAEAAGTDRDAEGVVTDPLEALKQSMRASEAAKQKAGHKETTAKKEKGKRLKRMKAAAKTAVKKKAKATSIKSAPRAKAAGSLRKKPAAALKKRPAANVAFDYMPLLTKAAMKKRTKGSFTSMAYCTTLKMTGSREEARKAYAAAAAAWAGVHD